MLIDYRRMYVIWRHGCYYYDSINCYEKACLRRIGKLVVKALAMTRREICDHSRARVHSCAR